MMAMMVMIRYVKKLTSYNSPCMHACMWDSQLKLRYQSAGLTVWILLWSQCMVFSVTWDGCKGNNG